VINNQILNAISYPLRELGWDYNQCINAILYTKRDWDSSFISPFRENVTEDGIILLG